MIHIKSVSLELDNFSKINDKFELGDLTIFIGRSNSGKTRILTDIANRIIQLNNTLKEMNLSLMLNLHGVLDSFERNVKIGIELEKINFKKNIKFEYVQSPRQKTNSYKGTGRKLIKASSSLKIIDPTISEIGTEFVENLKGDRRSLNEQGSGLYNNIQILDKLHEPLDIIIIDEPEISQFPYGKIEILRNMIEELDKKQIIFATHDPTLINQYLIKQICKDKNYKIVVYSFSGDSFKKVDFSSRCDPEIHVGYLSQTYSGKPIHLILEGQTEFYAFQALLTKYCIYKKIQHFPKFLNMISLSHIAGNQWRINIHHLPDTRYYRTLVLLDGEYSEEIKNLEKNMDNKKFNIMKSFDDISDDKVNIMTLKNENFDKAFREVFGEEYSKPLGLSQKIWSLSEDEFKKIDFEKSDMKLIKQIMEWCLEKTGCRIKQQ